MGPRILFIFYCACQFLVSTESFVIKKATGDSPFNFTEYFKEHFKQREDRDIRFNLTRDFQDTLTDEELCQTIQLLYPESWKRMIFKEEECTCKPQYSTLMWVVGGGHGICHTPEEIGCKYSLGNANRSSPYILRHEHDSLQLHPPLPKDSVLKNISIWNTYSSLFSTWSSITDVASNFFTLDKRAGVSLSISNFAPSMWQGKIVKFDFGGGKCALAKIKGNSTYPFDIDRFKREVVHGMTTKAPTQAPTTRVATTMIPTTKASRFSFLLDLQLKLKLRISGNL